MAGNAVEHPEDVAYSWVGEGVERFLVRAVVRDWPLTGRVEAYCRADCLTHGARRETCGILFPRCPAVPRQPLPVSVGNINHPQIKGDCLFPESGKGTPTFLSSKNND